MNNAYIDNQNLFMATHCAKTPWDIDMGRFRVYLKEKYDVENSYLFMGVYLKSKTSFYSLLKNLGYQLVFRIHEKSLKTAKKGNVDTDLVFHCMRDIKDTPTLDRIILVSGDGDYYKMAKYLSETGRLQKILLPSHKNASSLYKSLSRESFSYLDDPAMIKKIGK